MSAKKTATQNAANAVGVYAQAVNNYGQNSPEARGAKTAAVQSITTARQHGVTDNDLRAARPA